LRTDGESKILGKNFSFKKYNANLFGANKIFLTQIRFVELLFSAKKRSLKMTRRNLFLVFNILAFGLFFSAAVSAQTGIKIIKKTQIQFPGMPKIDSSKAQTGGAKKAIEMANGINKPKIQTVYIKNSRMRTDSQGVETQGGIWTMAKLVERIDTDIVQCDKRQIVRFNSRKKKYFVAPFDTNWSAASAGSKSASGKSAKGVINVVNNITDTGERMKLFGYNAQHLKQSITFTGSKNSCLQGAMKMEVDGWYADIPEFSCPLPSEMTEMPMADGECADEIRVTNKGAAMNGVALKEIRTMTMDRQKEAFVQTEEVVELTKTALEAGLFEPPAGYSLASNKAELKNGDGSNASNNQPNDFPSPNGSDTGNYTTNPMLAPPSAGMTEPQSLAPKKAGMIRIGIAPPNVKTPAKNADSAEPLELSTAVRDSLVSELKSEKVEAIQLSTAAPEAEAKQKGCDYILYANVTQKRGGGGMFGKMIAMGALTAVGAIVPGVGTMIATQVGSIVLQQQMGKAAKAKDEFTFDYKVTDLNNVVLSQAVTKAKAKKDGEDVLSPQIQQASKTILAQIAGK
jgi:hypothetical protein